MRVQRPARVFTSWYGCSCWSAVMATNTWRHRDAAMATSKMSLGLVAARSRQSSVVDYSPAVSHNEQTIVDDADTASRLPSLGDISVAIHRASVSFWMFLKGHSRSLVVERRKQWNIDPMPLSNNTDAASIVAEPWRHNYHLQFT